MRTLLRLILLVVLVVAIGVFFLGWNVPGLLPADAPRAGRAVGTTGEAAAERGREAGAAIGERAGQAADAAGRAVSDGSLTAKIKAKMALDDTVKALDLDVDTNGSVVTVTGIVRSESGKARALQLARDTEGVTQVIDRIEVR